MSARKEKVVVDYENYDNKERKASISVSIDYFKNDDNSLEIYDTDNYVIDMTTKLSTESLMNHIIASTELMSAYSIELEKFKINFDKAFNEMILENRDEFDYSVDNFTHSVIEALTTALMKYNKTNPDFTYRHAHEYILQCADNLGPA